MVVNDQWWLVKGDDMAGWHERERERERERAPRCNGVGRGAHEHVLRSEVANLLKILLSNINKWN